MTNSITSSKSQNHIYFKNSSKSLLIEITTDRLYIRSYKKDDLKNCLELYANENITKYFDNGRPRTRSEVRKLIQKKSAFFAKNQPFGLFSIFDKKNMNFIGQFDFMPFKEGVIEIGFILQEQFHNKGIGSEAIDAFIFNYALEVNQNFKCQNLPIHKILATAHPENAASIRVLEKNGMSFEKKRHRFGNPRLWFSIFLEKSQSLKPFTAMRNNLPLRFKR